MIKRQIKTNLMKKLETFKIMALGEAVKTPILLIGPPGVAKTQAVIDFARASLGTLKGDDLFLLETDEGTRSNAVKGNVDLEMLTTQNKYKVDSPVTRAKVVVINEIDKGSASLRNSLLGIMNEKVLFNGKEKVPCKWSNFIATCNEIPDDEIGSPFWDRFLITHEVKRLSPSDMLKYYSKGGKAFSQKHDIQLPEQSDIDSISLDPKKLKKAIDLIYNNLSDRALSFLPTLIKNVMCVWNFDQDNAFVKTAELLAGKEVAKNLAKTLVPDEIKNVYDMIDMIGSSSNHEEYNKNYDKLEALTKVALSAGVLTKDVEENIKSRLTEEEDKLSFLIKNDEVYDDLNNQLNDLLS